MGSGNETTGDEVAKLDGAAQAELVRRGDMRARELVQGAIRRAERLNPVLNVIVAMAHDAAGRTPDQSAGESPRFYGVPVLLKDLGACQAGLPRSMGNRVLKELGLTCPRDSYIGARLRQAGFVTIGVTNTSEFGWQPTTQPLAFGPTRNPWALDLSPSGSSGGAAAAVAAGIVPIATGSDAGGSIRTPASWCGVVGLKPSHGLTASRDVDSRSLVEHVLARSVRDTAAVLDVLAGDEAFPARRRPRYLDALEGEPGGLRVGVLTKIDSGDVSVDPSCVAAAESAGRLLEELGHTVEYSSLRALFDDAFVANLEMLGSWELRRVLERMAAVIGRPVTADDVEPYTWARAEQAALASSASVLGALDWEEGYRRRIRAWWEDGWDILITPTTATPPMPLESLTPPPSEPNSILPIFRRIWCFAAPFSVTGQPAISLPLAWTDTGLPVGVQLVADLGRDDVLIGVAGQLERARPWQQQHPRVQA